MTTVATAALTDFAKRWCKLYQSAQCVGIVGDNAHAARGGYHIGRSFQSPSNYSCTRPQDKYGPGDASAAVDIRMSAAEMVVCTRRLYVLYANTADPRRKYLNGFNGWDGTGSATRYDIYAHNTKAASDDHKWHIHLEFRRMYVNSAVAMNAVLSALAGQTAAAYLKSVGVTAVKPRTTKSGALIVPPYPGRVLKPTASSVSDMAVKRWQARMVARGWTTLGRPDGFFGAKTEFVVRRFQVICKVTSDGEIGRVTWALPWTWPMG